MATQRSVKPKILALLFLTMLAAGSCGRHEQTNSQETPVLSGPPQTTYPMPPLPGTNVGEMGWVGSEKADAGTGQVQASTRRQISDFSGKVLVLDFYATWCAPCRQSIPHLSGLQDKYGTRGLEIVGLNVGGPDDRIKVGDFARELAISYQLGFPEKALTDFLLSDNQTIPQTFVFDRSGQLAKRFIGFNPAIQTELEQLIERLVELKNT